MNYWIDLFTGTTWREFREAGATVSGFRAGRKKMAQRIKPGDIFLCYLTGVMRWVGALEVSGLSSDRKASWKEQDFPVRFEVKPLILLEPEHGVPMEQLEGEVSFYANRDEKGKFRGLIQGSPNLFQNSSDGEKILARLREAERNPISRPVDPKKLAREPLYTIEAKRGKGKQSTLVSVPEPEDITPCTSVQTDEASETASSRHTEIQYQLLTFGAELGLDVWVARNDRGRRWNGDTLGSLARIVDQLPAQFNDATNRTLELIDVLWLSGNSIVAAFEVECTTSVYSGLLRMNDLLALEPNLDINLFLVAPDESRTKVEQELLRPTFSLREKPLARICGFLPFSTLCEKLEAIRRLGLSDSVKPTFMNTAAEYFTDDDGG